MGALVKPASEILRRLPRAERAAAVVQIRTDLADAALRARAREYARTQGDAEFRAVAGRVAREARLFALDAAVRPCVCGVLVLPPELMRVPHVCPPWLT